MDANEHCQKFRFSLTPTLVFHTGQQSATPACRDRWKALWNTLCPLGNFIFNRRNGRGVQPRSPSPAARGARLSETPSTTAAGREELSPRPAPRPLRPSGQGPPGRGGGKAPLGVGCAARGSPRTHRPPQPLRRHRPQHGSASPHRAALARAGPAPPRRPIGPSARPMRGSGGAAGKERRARRSALSPARPALHCCPSPLRPALPSCLSSPAPPGCLSEPPADTRAADCVPSH